MTFSFACFTQRFCSWINCLRLLIFFRNALHHMPKNHITSLHTWATAKKIGPSNLIGQSKNATISSISRSQKIVMAALSKNVSNDDDRHKIWLKKHDSNAMTCRLVIAITKIKIYWKRCVYMCTEFKNKISNVSAY